MKPILFAPTATEFDNNGLGALVDAPRCIVREERNGPYELEMDYPVDGQHFSEIEHSAIIYAIPADGKGAQPFRIYEISKPFDGLCTIYAEHISYQLAHIPVTPFGKVTSVAAALQGLKNNAAESCPYTFWTDKTSAGTFEVTEPKSIRELLGGTQGSILDAFGGGEYEWDKYTVKLHQHRGQDKGVVIKYGRNLTDLKQEEAIDTTITGIYPFWADSESGTLVTLPEKVIHSANAGNFPYNRTVVVDASSEFQDEPTVAQLRSFANNYITQTGVGVPKVSIDISFAPLWQTEEYRDIANLERVNLCDTVTVVFEKLGVTASAKVVKTEYDVLNERYETIELGDARTNLAREVSSDISNSVNSLAARIPTKNAIESIVDAQTALITGAMGGYIKIVYNAAGQPQELLFMDTDDIQTAVNVIRINKNGIGFSNDGYDPTKFVSAWTIDGKFSADFIATGHLLANYIQGGTLTLGGADNGNGVLQILNASNKIIGQWDKDGVKLQTDVKKWVSAQSAMKIVDAIASMAFNYATTSWFLDDVYCGLIGQQLYKNISGQTFAQYSLPLFVMGGNSLTLGLLCDHNGNDGSGNTFPGDTDVMKIDYSYYSNFSEASVEFFKNLVIQNSKKIYMTLNGGLYINMSNPTSGSYIGFTGSTNAYDVTIRAHCINLNTYQPSGVYSAYKAYYNGTEIAKVSSSSRRYKHSIAPLSEALDPHKLLDLPVIQFEWNEDHPLQYGDMAGKTIPGIIAEDVDRIYPVATIHNLDTGEIESWDERRIIPGMLALIQEQDERIKKLEDANKELLTRLERLEKMLT